MFDSQSIFAIAALGSIMESRNNRSAAPREVPDHPMAKVQSGRKHLRLAQTAMQQPCTPAKPLKSACN